jgi:hypothetical protein
MCRLISPGNSIRWSRSITRAASGTASVASPTRSITPSLTSTAAPSRTSDETPSNSRALVSQTRPDVPTAPPAAMDHDEASRELKLSTPPRLHARSANPRHAKMRYEHFRNVAAAATRSALLLSTAAPPKEKLTTGSWAALGRGNTAGTVRGWWVSVWRCAGLGARICPRVAPWTRGPEPGQVSGLVVRRGAQPSYSQTS